MARDKLTRWCRLYGNGYDLSGDALSFSMLMQDYQEVDMTVWSDAINKFLSNDRMNVGINGFKALLNDDANQAFSILKTPPISINLTMCLGSGAEPTVGDPAYHLPAVTTVDLAALDGGKATIGPVDFKPEAGSVGANYLKPWGEILQAATSISETTTGASRDNDDSSAAGYHAMLHVLATSSGDYEFKIEHSANDSDWSTLATFTADGSAITSEFLSGSGSVNQYVRAVSTKTGGSVTALITFSRNQA